MTAHASRLASVVAIPAAGPLLGWLVAGFVVMAGGLVALTARRHEPIPRASLASTRRALAYAVVYAACSSCFYRVISGALLGHDQSPWLLALGDVLAVTLGLFAWVMTLAEGHDLAAYGLRGAPSSRMGVTILMGLGAAALFAFRHADKLLRGLVHPSTDSVVFAGLFAAAGSAVPEELIFRGYLQGSLSGRMGRWAQVALPALVFTAVRALRFLPGVALPVESWLAYVAVVLPLGLWWGLMRDLAGGSIWPCLISHFLIEFVATLARSSPAAS